MLTLPKKGVTEEDAKATEIRLAESFAGFKSAITSIPSEVAKPVTGTVRAHPYISMAAAAGAGFALYRLLDILMPRTKVITREVKVQPQIEIKEQHTTSLGSRLVSEAIAMATPYLTSYVQREVSRLVSKSGENEPVSADATATK